MTDVNFHADAFTSEILCDRCDNRDDCSYNGTDDDDACDTYKTLNKERD